MHINTQTGILGAKPLYISKPLSLGKISFGQTSDVFEKSLKPELSLEQSIVSSYNDIERQLGIVNGQDIVGMVNRIHLKAPHVSKEDIVYTMGVLSQYSSYKSWEHLEKSFVERDIYSLNNLDLYKNNKTKGRPVCLNSVMSYLASKCCEKFISKEPSVDVTFILDSKLLKMIEESPEILENIKENRLVPLYINNFENGYNFLNQADNFEDFTLNVIKQCSGDDIKTELNYVLNKENLDRAEKLGLTPEVIDCDVKSHPADIADNLNPIIPTLDEFSVLLEGNTGSSIENKINILNSVSVFVSPRKYCENMKLLYEKIEKIINRDNLENVYYAVPDYQKSFCVANYVYQKANNIPEEQFINYNFNIFKSDMEEEITSFPQRFALVVLDDVSATGSSLLNNPFFYTAIPRLREISGKDVSIIIAPMYSTKMAKSELESNFESSYKGEQDNFVQVEILPNFTKEMSRGSDNALASYIGDGCLTSIIFPYMGPDTNDSRLLGLYEKLLYTPNAQKKL